MNTIDSEKLISYWKDASTDDMQSSIDIIANTKSYIQGLFFLHLAIEKALKAFYVKTHNSHAPLTHNLLSLAQKCELEFDDPLLADVMVEINQFNLEMRYPEDLKTLKAMVTKEYAARIIADGEKVRQWILVKLN